MEKAILRTLIYADIFDYPLKAWEIHKWLIGKKASFKQIVKAIKRLEEKLRHQSVGVEVKSLNGFYFLSSKKEKRQGLVKKRNDKEKISKRYLRDLKIIAYSLRIIPFIRLIGVSGSLSMENAGKRDDLDLFIITQKNRLWISRILVLGIIFLFGKRRKRGQEGRESAGKVCVNLLLEDDRLTFSSRNIYLAHEVLQMKVLWEKDGIYSQFLENNEWVFKYLPNWKSKGKVTRIRYRGKKKDWNEAKRLTYWLEELAKWFQLRYMGNPKGQEKILEGALYLHPVDQSLGILKKYTERVKKLNLGESGHSR